MKEKQKFDIRVLAGEILGWKMVKELSTPIIDLGPKPWETIGRLLHQMRKEHESGTLHTVMEQDNGGQWLAHKLGIEYRDWRKYDQQLTELFNNMLEALGTVLHDC